VITANILYLELLKHHNTAIVTALTYSAPVIVLLLSMIIFKEKLTTTGCIGIFLVICGTVIVGLANN
jgi:drug/metabolite transporter (DMT)-like permease